jgi:hypothetical protein
MPGAPNATGTPNASGTQNPPAGMPGVPGGAPAWTPPGMPQQMRGYTPPVGVANSMVPGTNTGGSIAGNGGFGSSISGNGGFGTPGSTPAGGYPVNSQTQGQSPYPIAPGSNRNTPANFNNPALTGNPDQQALAARTINQLLTSPRPGGAPSAVPTMGVGTPVVGGLAGVASTFKGHGIKRYNDQDEYQKWEFYYDLSGEMAGAQRALTPATTTPQNNSGFGNSGFSSPNPFGSGNGSQPPTIGPPAMTPK